MTVQTTPQDAVLARIRAHHDRLGRTVADHTVTIARSIDKLVSPSARQAVLAAFCAEEVLPHAAAEEETLYRVADALPATRLLAQAMRDEHTLLRERAGELERAGTWGEIVAAAAALDALFQSHLDKENALLLPALADAGVDLSALLEGMHEILGEPAGPQGCGCGGCGCGARELAAGGTTEGTAGDTTGDTTGDTAGNGAGGPEPVAGELDVRRMVPARRHAQIFAAFGGLPAGTAFVLVNDHDPKPLYYQFAAEHPGAFTWEYAESGPQVWRVRIGRP
ncbi:DUF2249 domain-containing protein [Planomonospora venezuelensis]|uniref:Uncharacterized protein (DUF2249 family) n=1 Tax=Planomonospora venezuelensis TaxID=1999 RepID=A0A841DHH2_PLAVE|nr:DUF2249 domain-containing protein [Planomonospora venezuelensis]MBB5967545.1 uncharacterized protein (DUF2249 family) [Planomonospora venezuelensis]GIN04786.1 hypothetical protein Pve01_64440 [Planomonospora venezuelensis]